MLSLAFCSCKDSAAAQKMANFVNGNFVKIKFLALLDCSGM